MNESNTDMLYICRRCGKITDVRLFGGCPYCGGETDRILSDKERAGLGLPWPGTYQHDTIQTPAAHPQPINAPSSPIAEITYRMFRRQRVRIDGMLTWRWQEVPSADASTT